jgi:uridylate kinase
MDSQSIIHCKEQSIPIIVYNYQREDNLERVLTGERVGTRIGDAAAE